MEPLINIDESKCTVCYACLRACPVNAIEIKLNKEFPEIFHSRCIGCGSCVTACSPGAINYRDSKKNVKNLLQTKQKVVAIVAPSISGEFSDITDYRKFVKMIKALGFHHVNEVSFGADLVAFAYKDLIDNFKGKYYLGSYCPVVVNYVQKYFPELVDNLTPLMTPMAATAIVVKKIYGEDTTVVYIGPCLAVKDEIHKPPLNQWVDEVLTFVELRQLFDECNIKESALEFEEFDAPIGYKGSILPISNGILQAAGIDEDLLTGVVITTEGADNMKMAVKEFEKSIEIIKHHFNLYFCEGCLMGPGTSPGGEKFLRRSLVTDYANRRLKNFDIKTWEKNFNSFKDIDLSRTFSPDDQRRPLPAEENIMEILKAIGKADDKNLKGCGACGYSTCRDFAIAVCMGQAKTDMCLTYSLKNKQEYIKTLKATNEKLIKANSSLTESEKNLQSEKIALNAAYERASTMLNKIPSAIVIVDNALKIIESNQAFVDILGPEAAEINEIIPRLIGADIKTLLPVAFHNLFTFVLNQNEDIQGRDLELNDNLLNVYVFSIVPNKVAGAVFRDMQLPEVQKEELIKRLTDVIDENLEMVQKIGFLLGEGAAKTERMLNSLIQSQKRNS